MCFSIYDVLIVIILLPLFLARAAHYLFDRILFPERASVENVNSFAAEFRTISVLHIPPKSPQASSGLVVLVHGACARMQQFSHVIRYLLEKGFEIVAFDALGCGMSSKPSQPGAYRISEMYADLEAVIKKYAYRQKAVAVIGHSIGAAMLARFATSSDCSSLVRSMVLIAPPVISGEKSRSTDIFKLPSSILWLIRPWMGVQARKLLFGPQATDTLKSMEREASARNPVYMFKAFYSQIDREFLNMSKATKLNVPTLFIGADCDNICPAGPIKDLSQRLGCQYVVAKDCGHQCMQEDPKQINGYIGDFLSSLQ